MCHRLGQPRLQDWRIHCLLHMQHLRESVAVFSQCCRRSVCCDCYCWRSNRTSPGHSRHMYVSVMSLQVEENEEVVQYALEHRHVKIADSGLNFGRPGLTKYDL